MRKEHIHSLALYYQQLRHLRSNMWWRLYHPATGTPHRYQPLFWSHSYFPFHPQQVHNSGAVITLHKQVIQLILNTDNYSSSCRQGACFLTKNKAPSASLCHLWFYRNWPSPELRISFSYSILLFRSRSVSLIIPDVFHASITLPFLEIYTVSSTLHFRFGNNKSLYDNTVIYCLGFRILYQTLSTSLFAFW